MRKARCRSPRSVILLIFTFAACTNRADPEAERRCEWREDDRRTLDLLDAADRAHLRDDAILAEDLAIGHADRRAERRSDAQVAGYNRVRTECMERLFSDISTRHNVALEVVRQYRLHRNRLADVAVIGAFGLLYLAAAYVISGWLVQRFASDHVVVVVVGIAMVSLGMATAGMMLGEVWSIWFEVIPPRDVRLWRCALLVYLGDTLQNQSAIRIRPVIARPSLRFHN